MKKTYNQLQKEYKRYVQTIANNWSNKDEHLKKDLEQVGYIAIYTHINKIDEKKGNEKSYITTIIKYEMMKYLTNYGRTVRVPNNTLHGQFKEEIKECVSLSSLIYKKEDQTTIEDIIIEEEEDNTPDDEAYNLNKALNLAIEQLKPQQQYIVKKYYGYYDNEAVINLEILATELGISRQAVHQQLQKALKKIKTILNK